VNRPHSIPPDWLTERERVASERANNWIPPARPDMRDRRDPQKLGETLKTLRDRTPNIALHDVAEAMEVFRQEAKSGL
jgi:hypothetical protein